MCCRSLVLGVRASNAPLTQFDPQALEQARRRAPPHAVQRQSEGAAIVAFIEAGFNPSPQVAARAVRLPMALFPSGAALDGP